jgi:hypothetical protein
MKKRGTLKKSLLLKKLFLLAILLVLVGFMVFFIFWGDLFFPDISLSPSVNVERSVESLGNDIYEVTIDVRPNTDESIVLKESVLTGNVLSDHHGFENLLDYHGLVKIEGNNVEAVMLSSFTDGKLNYRVQSSAEPTFSGTWMVPLTKEQGAIQ